MKAYILTDKDFDKLLAEIDRDPEHGLTGGSSMAISQEQRDAFKTAHGFYNFVIRRWLQSVKE